MSFRPAFRRPSAAPRDGGSEATLMDSAAMRQQRWKAVPADHRPTPEVNSPEWQKEQAETDRKDRELDRKIRGICRGC